MSSNVSKFEIIGGKPILGEVSISGSKNASLPILAASILTDGDVYLTNLPNITDITFMCNILMNLGTEMSINHRIDNSNGKIFSEKVFKFNSKNIHNLHADYELVKKMRASIVLLGPCLSKFGQFEISLPGGCVIGVRPINYHLNALKKMGAYIDIENGCIKAKGKLFGTDIALEKPSMGATQNILMAAIYAKGTTRIRNACKEPEIVTVCDFLKAVGAKIYGAGTDTLEIEGDHLLKGTEYRIPADRLEAGTYCCMAVASDGRLILKNAKNAFLGFREQFEQIGVGFNYINEDTVEVFKKHDITGLDIMTDFYPGFPTDLQAQVMTLLCLADRPSVITETIWENRFMHVAELNRMGADISIISSDKAQINPIKQFQSANVMATDLRASACLIIAALNAKGKSIIDRVYHIERGYEDIVHKLRNCGVNIAKIY